MLSKDIKHHFNVSSKASKPLSDLNQTAS